MLKPIRLTEKEKQILIEMYKNNEPVANIGIALGYSGSFIYKQIQEMLEDGSLERRPKVTVSTDRRKKEEPTTEKFKKSLDQRGVYCDDKCANACAYGNDVVTTFRCNYYAIKGELRSHYCTWQDCTVFEPRKGRRRGRLGKEFGKIN